MVRRAIIASHVSPEAFEPGACRALQKLGYEIVPAGAPGGGAHRPIRADLRIVDEASLGEIPDERPRSVAAIIVTREPAPLPAKGRVVASLMRPALFRDLYAAIQRALEPTPRSHPRVTTALPARCAYERRACPGVVISLSEGGCLFRSAEPPPPERETHLQFSLPRPGLISARARHLDRRASGLGLAFQGLAPDSRAAISRYVMDQLVAD